MFSSAEESYESAVWELRGKFGRDLQIERIGPDLGVLPVSKPQVKAVAEACDRQPLVFIRHLTVERARVPRDEAEDVEAVVAAALNIAAEDAVAHALALQIWVSGSPKTGWTSGELHQRLSAALESRGITVSRSGQKRVLSCCVTEHGVLIGSNLLVHSISDWPGGRVRLARSEDMISRAEFKLEELFQLLPIELPQGGRAADLGASPGGWTRVLRQRGLAVWAVDPGELDPRVAADPQVHHARTTAGEFFRSGPNMFDVIVNDMRMDPVKSCRVMLDAARRLHPDGLAIMTLKTGIHRPAEVVERCLSLLEREYRVEYARQLHHNRHEVTVVLSPLSY